MINARDTVFSRCRNYTGPQRTFEKTPSQKPGAKGGGATLATTIEIDEDSHSRFLGDHFRQSTVPEKAGAKDDSEAQWEEFRMPRTTLLSLVADYYTVSSARLAELNKKQGQDKTSEPFDVKCNTVPARWISFKLDELLFIKRLLSQRLADIAHTLLKVSSYDATTMACRGLQQYMTVLMPNGDWSQEPMKQVLNTLFRRVCACRSRCSPIVQLNLSFFVRHAARQDFLENLQDPVDEGTLVTHTACL